MRDDWDNGEEKVVDTAEAIEHGSDLDPGIGVTRIPINSDGVEYIRTIGEAGFRSTPTRRSNKPNHIALLIISIYLRGCLQRLGHQSHSG